MAEIKANKRKILVAVDEGKESMYALSWCLKNMACRNYNDTLVLLYAKQPRPIYSPMSMDGTGRRERFNGGYLFSDDIVAAVDKYTIEVADNVMEKAKRMCNEACDKVLMDILLE